MDKHSLKLIDHLKQEIETAGGSISFARFMDHVLYAKGLGYYTAGLQKFGRLGDFVTAPEISPLFAKCFAKSFQHVLNSLNKKDILEFGAGSGIFAKEVLLELERLGTLPDHYYILEVSAELRHLQSERIKTECPQFLSRMLWLDSLPNTFTGIIFANEVLDAMPVHRFEWNHGKIVECCVALENNQFVWQNKTPSNDVQKRVEVIVKEYPLPDGYRSEVNLMQTAWINSIADFLQEGIVFLVDYGYGRREYYHPERSDGTFMCFYQHQKHSDPFTHIGLQDMTAHVDFTAIAESADEAGLQVAGFTTQAAFLLACGLLDIAAKNNQSEKEKYISNQSIKTLTLPSQMGEVVKVMALAKNKEIALLGFEMQDRRGDL